TNMAAATPLLGSEGPLAILGPGNDARFMLLGAKSVGQTALLRFYVLHCVVLPFVFAVFLSIHFWRVRKDDFSAVPLPPREERKKGLGVEEWIRTHRHVLEEKIFVWPHVIAREFVAILVATVVLFGWSLLANAPLEEVANPNKTPNPSKAPWYFVGLQELLVYFDPWIAGVVLPTAILIGLMCLPYIDTNPKGAGYYNVKDRKFAFSMFSLGLGMWFTLILIGYYLRGPGWEWYWPGQPWDIHRATSQTAMSNLPNWVGIPLILLFFGAFAEIPKRIWKPFYSSVGHVRYMIAMMLTAGTFFVILKIILRLTLRVKYIVSFPGLNLNI
ncbi:MAG: cytochrome b N-terminal domain-containing protein, partial [Candidatus Omnitrophica bacterium]|nr:cytochrome b N-terminal domain-containing protein [Candidatus Omnitrophota bacterium]